MFDRVRMKEIAKNALKRRYWIVVLAAVLVGLLGGQMAGGTVNTDVSFNLSDYFSDSDINTDTDYDEYYGGDLWDQPDNPWVDGGGQQGGTVWDEYAYEEDASWAEIWENFKAEFNAIMEEFAADMGIRNLQTGIAVFFGIIAVAAAVVVILGLLYAIFVGNVMTVSGHGWMLRHLRGEEVSVGEAFAAFRIYKPSVVTMLVRGIYVWLWGLLFIIPGIVKAYAYSMVPYIIYENPNLTANQAIKMSKKMTDGYKGDLFVLNLSFIGWMMLSVITGGLVGIFWSNPYMGLTHAGAYEDLKWKAIQSGKLTWEDFGQTPPPPADPFETMWGAPAPQQAWGQPAPQQTWGNPAPQQPFWEQPTTPTQPQPQPENNPTEIRW